MKYALGMSDGSPKQLDSANLIRDEVFPEGIAALLVNQARLFSASLLQRPLNDKGRLNANLTPDLNGALVGLDDAVADGEPRARSKFRELCPTSILYLVRYQTFDLITLFK